MKVYRIIAAIGFIILAAVSATAMTTYALSAASCIQAGWDGGTKVTSGQFTGMYVCYCNSPGKQSAVEKQYELVLTNIYKNRLTFSASPTSPLLGKTIPIVVSPVPDQPASAAAQARPQQ